MQKRHQDMEVFRKAGVELHYSLTPFNRLRLEDPTLVNMLLLCGRSSNTPPIVMARPDLLSAGRNRLPRTSPPIFRAKLS
ncbi:hypothetical protein, partial [Porphyromonas gingivalis]|uniref:hypothetical protein n=1 Tax=Porphyromonas gingivalis TaxID=837 RepID=UPI0015CF52BA